MTSEVREAMRQWLAEQKRVEDYRHLERELLVLAPEAQRCHVAEGGESSTQLLVPLGAEKAAKG